MFVKTTVLVRFAKRTHILTTIAVFGPVASLELVSQELQKRKAEKKSELLNVVSKAEEYISKVFKKRYLYMSV